MYFIANNIDIVVYFEQTKVISMKNIAARIFLFLGLIPFLLGCGDKKNSVDNSAKAIKIIQSFSDSCRKYNMLESYNRVDTFADSAILYITNTVPETFRDSLAKFYLRKANATRVMGYYAEAWRNYQFCLNISNDSQVSRQTIFRAYYGLATLFYYYDQQNLSVALKYIRSARRYAKDRLESAQVLYFSCEADIASLKFDTAQQELEILERYIYSDTLKLSRAQFDSTYKQFFVFFTEDSAKIEDFKSITFSNEVLDIYDRCISMNRYLDEIKSNKYQIASVLYYKSRYLLTYHKSIDDAISCLREAYQLSDNINFSYIKMLSSNLLSSYYRKVAEADSAKKYNDIYMSLRILLGDQYVLANDQKFDSDRNVAETLERNKYKMKLNTIVWLAFGLILISTLIVVSATYARRKLKKTLDNEKNNLLHTKIKLSEKENQLMVARQNLTRKEGWNKIQKEILQRENLTSKLDVKFEFDDILKLIGELLGCEYCGIVINDIGDIYSWTSFPLTDVKKQELANIKVMILNEVQVCSVDYAEVTRFNYPDRPMPTAWNQIISSFETSILRSHHVENLILIGINYDGEYPSYKEKSIGYLGIINSHNAEDETSELRQLRQQLTHFLSLSFDRKRNEKKERDKEFIQRLHYDNYNFTNLLVNISEYLTKEFNLATVSFRVPVPNGKVTDYSETEYILLPLRSIYVDPLIENKHGIKRTDVERYYKERRNVFSKVETNYKQQIFGVTHGYGPYFDYEVEQNPLDSKILGEAIRANVKIILPIKKNINISPNNNGEDNWKRVYGIFNLRPYNDVNVGEINERLSYLSQGISDIVNAIINKNRHNQILLLENEIDSLKFEPKNFYQQIAQLIVNVVKADACSIFIYDNYGEILKLRATTAESAFLNEAPLDTTNLKKIDQVFYTLKDSDPSIVVTAFNDRAPYLIYSISEYVKSDKYIEQVSAKNHDSVLVVPIKNRNGDPIGIIKCMGKVFAEETDLIYSFWHFEKETLMLIASIAERFIENIELDRLKDFFVNSVVHETLTPLTEIMGKAELLLERNKRGRFSLPPDFEKYFKSLFNNIFLQKYIILGVQKAIKQQSGEMEITSKKKDVKRMLSDVIQLFEESANLERKKIIANIKEMPEMFVDEILVKQAFINLLKNAINYSYPDTTIEIYYKYVEANVNGIQSVWYEIKFENSGIGIPFNDKENIFSLYHRGSNAKTLRPSGSGIGLFLARKIMRAHGGDCIIKELQYPKTVISLYFPSNILQKQ